MENNITSLRELNVLVIEDELHIMKNMIYTLEIFYQKVFSAYNIKEAYKIFSNNNIDLIISDIKLSNECGLDFVTNIRSENYSIPIIIVTAHSDSQTLLKAANLGIDGYLIKPVNLEELLNACLKVLNKGKKLHHYFTKNLYYDYRLKALLKDNQLVELGVKEHKLLKLFLNNKNKTLSKEDIEQYIWPLDEITNSALKNLLNRLRIKVGYNLIENIKGSGWRLNNME